MTFHTKIVISDCLRMLGLLITLVTAGQFTVSAANAATLQTTWTITVDVTGGGSSPNYKVDFDPPADKGGCIYAVKGVNPKKLIICPGDIVKWQGNSNGNKHQLAAFWADDLLTDMSGNSIFTLGASDGNPSSPGLVSKTATQLNYHEWFVALFDKKSSTLYIDDPKIMIGGDSVDADQHSVLIAITIPG